MLATFLLWPATYVMTAPLLAVAWSLSFGMLFYGCTALVLLDRRWLYALLFAYAVAFVLRPWGPIFEFLGNPIMIEFLFGVLIAQLPGVRFGSLGLRSVQRCCSPSASWTWHRRATPFPT
jgi:exopolysaccharide production protein ExoZ